MTTRNSNQLYTEKLQSDAPKRLGEFAADNGRTMLQKNVLEFDNKAFLQVFEAKVDGGVDSSGVATVVGNKQPIKKGLFLNPGGQVTSTAAGVDTLTVGGGVEIHKALTVLEGLTLCQNNDITAETTLIMQGRKINYTGDKTTATYSGPATICSSKSGGGSLLTLQTNVSGSAGGGGVGAKFEQKNENSNNKGENLLTAHKNKLENATNNYIELDGSGLSTQSSTVEMTARKGSGVALTLQTATPYTGTGAGVAGARFEQIDVSSAFDEKGANLLKANTNRMESSATNYLQLVNETLTCGVNNFEVVAGTEKKFRGAGSTAIYGGGYVAISAGDTKPDAPVTAAQAAASSTGLPHAYFGLGGSGEQQNINSVGTFTHYGAVHIKDRKGTAAEDGDLIIDGNLTVNGVTKTINTTQTTIADKEIVINRAGDEDSRASGNTASHGTYAGMRVERGPDRQDLLMRFNWDPVIRHAVSWNDTSLNDGTPDTTVETTPTVRFTRAMAKSGDDDDEQDACGNHLPGDSRESYDIGVICKHVVTSSDARWKHNIKPVRNSKDIIKKMRPVYWDWNGENTAGECGLIAQHVKKIAPDAVRGSEQEGYGLNYNYFIGLLMARVKELTKEVESMKK